MSISRFMLIPFDVFLYWAKTIRERIYLEFQSIFVPYVSAVIVEWFLFAVLYEQILIGSDNGAVKNNIL